MPAAAAGRGVLGVATIIEGNAVPSPMPAKVNATTISALVRASALSAM